MHGVFNNDDDGSDGVYSVVARMFDKVTYHLIFLIIFFSRFFFFLIIFILQCNLMYVR